MELQPLVSVIIPAFNAAGVIGPTIESALAQTYAHLEVLVIDDGSRDETALIVQRLAEADKRVVLLQQPNRGVAAARNLGLAHARGQYIAPLDADDLWAPTKIEKQVLTLESAGPSVGLAYTWWEVIDADHRSVSASHPWTVEGEVFDAHLALNFIGNASIPLIRRECFDITGGYDESFRARGAQGCEDWDLTLRIAEHFEFRLVPERLAGYRRVAGSMSADYEAMIRSHQLMLANLATRRPEVDASLLRWSRGQMYAYIVMIGVRTGDLREAARWFVNAVRSPDVALLTPWVLEVALARLPTAMGRPVAEAVWQASGSTRDTPSSTFMMGAAS